MVVDEGRVGNNIIEICLVSGKKKKIWKYHEWLLFGAVAKTESKKKKIFFNKLKKPNEL